MAGVRIIDQDQLPFSEISRELVGDDHAGLAISLIFLDAPPGRGPRLHRHAYDELLILQEGQATVVAGGDEIEARAGQIVIVPAGVPHSFVNSGDGPLRQIDIHLSPRFVTEWLEPPREDGGPAETGPPDATT